MKSFLTLIIFFTINSTFGQNNTSETQKHPEVSSVIAEAIANSSCACMNKLNLKTLITQEEKKNAMNNCLRQATKENEEKIVCDKKNSNAQSGYDAGKKYGVELGKKMRQLLISNCPRFKMLTE